MTKELERLEDQLRCSFEGEAWHGPAVLEVLAGVTADQAAARPIAGAHCIWEVALHLAGTYRLVLRRLSGDGAQLLLQDDWPPLPAITPENWSGTVEALRQLNLDLRHAVRAFAPDIRNHLGALRQEGNVFGALRRRALEFGHFRVKYQHKE
jgi:uncharacterized damage-inducible protein DinB